MKKKSNLILGIVITVIILLGSSYAFFVYNKIGKNEIVFEGGKIDIAFTSSSDDKVLVNGMYPKSDKEGLKEGVSYEFTDSYLYIPQRGAPAGPAGALGGLVGAGISAAPALYRGVGLLCKNL